MKHCYRQALIQGPFDPLSVVTQLTASGLLTDYVVYERGQRWYVAGDPLGHIRVDARWVTSTFGGFDASEPWSGTPWERVRSALAAAPVSGWNAYGWVAFELASRPEHTAADTLAHLMIPRTEVQVTRDGVLIRSLDEEMPRSVEKVLAEPHAKPTREAVPVDVRAAGAGTYRDGVAHAVAEIGGHRLRKVILSRSVPVPFAVDMPATYALGRAHNTPARSFLLDLGGWQAAGFSPETVVEVDAAGTASTQPLAGTRALTGDTATDQALRAELLSDPKEIYEHATSVKLACDEMATVGGGSEAVRVSEFLSIKPRGSVQHLASRVATTLADGHTAWDALEAVFPPVTASGIPKSAAYRLIEELEEEPRGLYAGTVLMAGSDGSLDAALVLRAVYQRDGRAWLRAGAGVVSASRPDREYEETCEKLMSVAPYLVPKEG
ncbi:salicylate synthase [Streptomyces sp. XD-27]|uniref:salicylate synthase n=1 Tax=Streptomyces sp. XD-27 TaxID=3062779 RepID=UPI0026F456A9|nr:salicylate synthase [Streptomyces sp. XD-27]WKX69041.1 salicylate synthase [Streptomyces sp. XD-27]